MPNPALEALKRLIVGQDEPLPEFPPTPVSVARMRETHTPSPNAGPYSISSDWWHQNPYSDNLEGMTIRPDRPRDFGGLQGYDMNMPWDRDGGTAGRLYSEDLQRMRGEEGAFRDQYGMSPDDAMMTALRKVQPPIRRR